MFILSTKLSKYFNPNNPDLLFFLERGSRRTNLISIQLYAIVKEPIQSMLEVKKKKKC